MGHSRANDGKTRSSARINVVQRANARASRARHSKPYAWRIDGGSDPIVSSCIGRNTGQAKYHFGGYSTARASLRLVSLTAMLPFASMSRM